MKRTVLFTLLLLATFTSFTQASWKPVGDKIMTQWGKEVNPENIWNEYPRPQSVRKGWHNLNGLWDYAIVDRNAATPKTWQGQILVPFAIESALSGVGKTVGDENCLWYHRTFTLPSDWTEKRILLNFEAVDWETTVWVNGKKVGSHMGGYDPFTFDVTDALWQTGEQTLTVRVWDPTDKGTEPHGKQFDKPHGIWYTSVTGIWQTVWLEAVPQGYIESVKITPDVDKEQLYVEVNVSGINPETHIADKYAISITALEGGTKIAATSGMCFSGPLTLDIPNPKLWSPDNPYLYNLQVKLLQEGSTADQIESYFGMRKIEVKKDTAGINRLFLNDQPLFQYGPLDQGYWPDGLYTPPSDEAMKYDLEFLKKIGMNMLRKHIKVEPRRLYYWCDKLGLLLWQDMPSGDASVKRNHPDIQRLARSSYYFDRELTAMIDNLYNHPSVVTWVIFNEGWGQFDTARVTDLVRKYDPTRLINSASGWQDRGTGDMVDMHRYPGPDMPLLEENRAVVLGEFGGLGLPIKDHTWQEEANWGYRSYKSPEALTEDYLKLMDNLRPFVEKGLAAAVYTQTTDVEIEVNGLMTYDRAVMKVDPDTLRKAHEKLYLPVIKKTTVPNAQKDSKCIQKTSFGTTKDGHEADLFTLTNASGMEVAITNYGGTIVSLKVPDRNGKLADIVLGFDNLKDYEEKSPYFGSIVGRCANRIEKGKFTLDGVVYDKLAINNGPNHLHGGLKGFDKVVWDATPIGNTLKLHYVSKDMEEGYPGNLDVTVTYTLTDENELKIDYEATTDKPTIVNLSNHSYFNLAGHAAGKDALYAHKMMINANACTPVDENLIPTGEIQLVRRTPMDFTLSKEIGLDIDDPYQQIQFGGGFDHNWVLNKDKAGLLSLAARVSEPTSGRVMEIYTTEPGLQFYSGNFMDGIPGKGGANYPWRSAIVLETQHYPDSPNHPNFPSVVLRPGQKYQSTTIYKFSAK